MNKRFRFNPPNARLETTSGKWMIPILSPSAEKTNTPSCSSPPHPLLVQTLPFVSTRKPSDIEAPMSQNTRLFDSVFPVTSKTEICLGWFFTCEAPGIGNIKARIIWRERQAIGFLKFFIDYHTVSCLRL